jgi:hypothetical protein
MKILHIQLVREGTWKVEVVRNRGKDRLRITVYPSPLPWGVYGDGPAQWLQSDLTQREQTAVLKAIKAKGEK